MASTFGVQAKESSSRCEDGRASHSEQYDRHPAVRREPRSSASAARSAWLWPGGLSVLGVDADERMSDVARSHGPAVEVAALEIWGDAGRQFDLITCAKAWHWIDPDLGVLKVARVLRASGAFARFWSSSAVNEAVVTAFDAVYRKHAPEVAQVWRPNAQHCAKVRARLQQERRPVCRQRRILLTQGEKLSFRTDAERVRVGWAGSDD